MITHSLPEPDLPPLPPYEVVAVYDGLADRTIGWTVMKRDLDSCEQLTPITTREHAQRECDRMNKEQADDRTNP